MVQPRNSRARCADQRSVTASFARVVIRPIAAWSCVVPLLLSLPPASYAQRRQEGRAEVPKLTELLPTPVGRPSSPAIAIDAAGHPSVAWSQAGSGEPCIYLLHWTGERWAELGHSASGRGLSDTVGTALAPSIQIDADGHPVVAWQDLTSGNYEIYLKRWNGTTWEEMQGSATKGGISQTLTGLSVDPSLTLEKSGNPLVAWEERFGANSDVYIRRLNAGRRGGKWEDVGGKAGFHGGMGGKIGRSAFPSMVLDGRDRPVVAWQDSLSGPFQIFLRTWSGSQWEELGGSAGGGGISHAKGNAIAASVALDSSGQPFVAWQQESGERSVIYVSRWDGKQWSGLGGSMTGEGIIAGLPGALLPSLAVDRGGTVIVAFQSGPPGHLRIYLRRWTGSAWKPWPGTADGLLNQPAASAENVRLVAAQGSVCMTWEETSGREKRIAVSCQH